jgi:hypothetical protein
VVHQRSCGEFKALDLDQDTRSLILISIMCQAPSHFLQPLEETSVEAGGFNLRYRIVEIRFHIDEMILGDEHGKVKLKCVAVVENFPRLVREDVEYIYVPSMEELRNQKLINWRNSAGKFEN